MFTAFIKLLRDNALLRNSAVFFTGSMLVNVGNYLYNIILARLLSVADYGEVQSLLSILIIFGIPLGTVSAIIIKYTARFKGADEPAKIHRLFNYFTGKLFWSGVVFAAAVSLLARPIAAFLNLGEVAPTYLLSGSILVLFLLTPPRSVLQGLQKFRSLSLNNLSEVIAKILFMVVFVSLGWRVSGVVGGLIAGALVAYLLSFLSIRNIFQHQAEKIDLAIAPMVKDGGIIFVSLLTLTLFYTLDVILVKHFMAPEIAGQYGGLAIVGRIVYFFTGAIVAVMFSMSAEVHQSNQQASRKVLQQSVILTILLSLGVLLIYILLPKLVILSLLGEKFLVIQGQLWLFGLAMALYGLVNLLSQYFISIGRRGFVLILAVGVFALTLAIILRHQTIQEVVYSMIGVQGLVLFGLLVYYVGVNKLEKNQEN